MTGTLGYDNIRAATVRQVAQLMAAAAITAPESGGQLFLAGKPRPAPSAAAASSCDPSKTRSYGKGRQADDVPSGGITEIGLRR